MNICFKLEEKTLKGKEDFQLPLIVWGNQYSKGDNKMQHLTDCFPYEAYKPILFAVQAFNIGVKKFQQSAHIERHFPNAVIKKKKLSGQ